LLLSSDLPGSAQLLRVSSIEFTDAATVPTIRMRFNPRTGTGIIQINRNFASQYADTPLRLAAAFQHELLHHLFHHYVIYPDDMITNLAQDILINALICRLSPTFQQLFNDVYDKTEFPGMALRPQGNLKRLGDTEIRETVASFYKKLYRKVNRSVLNNFSAGRQVDHDTMTVDDLTVALMRVKDLQEAKMADNKANGRDLMDGLNGLSSDWWEKPKKDGSGLQLLGDHPGEDDDKRDELAGDELDEEHAQDFRDMMDELIDNLSSNANAAALFKKAFKIDKEDAPDELVDAMNAALREDIMRLREIVEGVVGPRPGNASVVPRHIGRKETLMLSAGVFPLFYPMWSPEDKPNGGDVAVYIDVSGSMGDQAEFIVMLMTAFKQHISTEFYEFSTQIAEINFGELLERFESTGEVFIKTTGGTDFDPIFMHAQQKDHKKILIITDGQANLGEEAKLYAEQIETFTVFTIMHNPDPLTGVSSNTWVLPDIRKPLAK
jgi:hypothetical protein